MIHIACRDLNANPTFHFSRSHPIHIHTTNHINHLISFSIIDTRPLTRVDSRGKDLHHISSTRCCISCTLWVVSLWSRKEQRIKSGGSFPAPTTVSLAVLSVNSRGAWKLCQTVNRGRARSETEAANAAAEEVKYRCHLQAWPKGDARLLYHRIVNCSFELTAAATSVTGSHGNGIWQRELHNDQPAIPSSRAPPPNFLIKRALSLTFVPVSCETRLNSARNNKRQTSDRLSIRVTASDPRFVSDWFVS